MIFTTFHKRQAKNNQTNSLALLLLLLLWSNVGYTVRDMQGSFHSNSVAVCDADLI